MTTPLLLDQNSPENIVLLPDLSIDRRLHDIRKFGTQSLAFSSRQREMKAFRHPSFEGFIPYISLWGVDYVLSDPLTAPKDFLKATMIFLERSNNPVFCQISETYAKQLHSLNFKINSFGVEHIISLRDFQVSWSKRKRLKGYLSSLSKQDYYVFEGLDDMGAIKKINQQWLTSKNQGRELKFMARPFESLAEPDVRFFYLIKDKKILGYCSFDPIYSGDDQQRIVSYTVQHTRVADLAPSGAQDYLILNALFQFKQEGIQKISLGLSPLYQRGNDRFKHSILAEAVFAFIYRTNLFYKCRTIGEHKDQYKAEKNQTYIATKGGFSLKQLAGIVKVNNLV